jgi:hypothetical protein
VARHPTTNDCELEIAMRTVHRMAVATVVLFTLTGCGNGASTNTPFSNSPSTSASGTHSPAVVPALPACDATLVELERSRSASGFGVRIPNLIPGPMRLCRYRSAGQGTKMPVILVADITLPIAPVALMRALHQLKTVTEVYGPNGIFSCPMTQGAVDVVILRTAKGSELTKVEVQRDGCGFVIVNHIAYVSSNALRNQLDDVKAVS